MGTDNACLWRQDDLCGSHSISAPKIPLEYSGRIVFSGPKDIPAFPTTIIDDMFGLKLVKSEQFA